MFVAKMTTKYPELHGEGYYNFLVDESSDGVHWKIVDNSHDFNHEKTIRVDVEDVNELMEKYPTKEDLNKVFENAEV